MAPRKRSRDVHDINGEVEIESASSSFRQSNFPKRSRVALAQENGGSVVSDDDDELDGYLDGSGIADSTPTHHDESEDEDDGIDELRATQIIGKQMREHRDNMASEQGVIEEVYCRNFMCHTKLRIKLGPLINFIIGHNGSGKSAVLTALQMCLGGRASATNRGGSLKNLIKEGEESATLAVKIKNQGDGAYKPDLYGHSITVERNFSRAGTSGFKLKNTAEKIISTKKSDLDDILDFYAFQLDNPINVLTQDLARQFLSNSSPNDKYKFFIRGTQLEALDADYKLMEEHLDSIEAKLYSRQQDMASLKQRVEEAERKKKRSEQTEAIQDKIKRLQWMHAWAQVEEQEDILERYQGEVRDSEQKVQDKTEEAEEVSGAYEGHNQSFEAAQRNVEDFQGQLRPVTENHKEAKSEFDKNKEELLNRKAEERNIKEEMRKAKSVVQRLEGEVKKEQSRLAEAEGQEQTDRLEELEELKSRAEAVNQEQMEHGKGFAELERRRADAREQLEGGQQHHAQAKDGVDKAEGRLRSLEQNQGRVYGAYRPGMENLVRAINNETRWRSKPAGPMGRHIRLLKPEWSSQLERTIGGNLEAFIVTCKEDQQLLSQITKRVNMQQPPPIFIGHATRLDTTGKEPIEDVDTILRVLEIDNDLVRNSLIINQVAEQTVLIKDRTAAERFMFDSGKPRNVRVTLCITTNKGDGVRFDYSGSGAAKSAPIHPWNGQPRMKGDVQDQIRAQRSQREQAVRDLEASHQEVRRLAMAVKATEEELKRFDKRQNELRVEFQQAEDAVDQQQALIEQNRPQDGKLQELETQVREAKDELEAYENSFQDMIHTKDELIAKQREVKGGLDVVTAELAQIQARVDKAKNRLIQLQQARTKALQEKNLALELIDEAKRQQERFEQQVERQRAHLGQFVGHAENICRRVTVDHGLTCETIDKRLEKFIQDRQRAQREAGGSREELLEAFHRASNEYHEALAQIKGMVTFAKELKATLSYRQHRWDMFRKYIALRTHSQFTYLLSERQFRGRVLFDHKDKELNIAVEPDLSKVSDAGRATKTLSGGEKSFTTICLLLSIWEAMGSPIRCLDEFDVFMDNVNRATSMSMMIQAARRSVGRQFILITPQSMNSVSLGDDVKVHKMSDPERGQTTLPYA